MSQRQVQARAEGEGKGRMDEAVGNIPSMVVRVAKALAKGPQPTASDYRKAHAAIAAMREPNLAMRKVCTFEQAEVTWPAMIDAALGRQALAAQEGSGRGEDSHGA